MHWLLNQLAKKPFIPIMATRPVRQNRTAPAKFDDYVVDRELNLTTTLLIGALMLELPATQRTSSTSRHMKLVTFLTSRLKKMGKGMPLSAGYCTLMKKGTGFPSRQMKD